MPVENWGAKMVRLKRRLLSSIAVLGLLGGCAGESAVETPEPEPFNVVEATIGDIQSAIREGRATCRDIVSAYLERIDAYDKPTGLGAITEINPNALHRADEIDQALAAGEELGSLFCAPMLIKDNYDTHDMATTGGSIALKGVIPPDDAFMVRRLREADAIVIAKTNMAEWAFSPRHTVSSSYGRTANAYDLNHTPAGSSGGTASGTAASFGVAGMGSDTGNSIRGPSSHLALFGIRSTIGLTSRDGIIPLAFDRDIAGPMTRTVEDGARIFNVVAGYDPADPYTELGRGRREDDYTAFLDKDGLRGARIGVLRALVDTEDADPLITQIFERALVDLASAGAEIVDPFVLDTLDSHLDAPNFCARFRYDARVYLESLGDRTSLRDIATLLETGQHTSYGERAIRFFADSPLDIHPADRQEPCPDYADHTSRQAFLSDLVAAMDEAGVDVIVYPTWTNPPAALETAIDDYKGDNSQLIAPATGIPAVSVPMGMFENRLPAGLQIAGRPYSEGLLIKLAYAYEQATLHRVPPPLFPPLTPAGKR